MKPIVLDKNSLLYRFVTLYGRVKNFTRTTLIKSLPDDDINNHIVLEEESSVLKKKYPDSSFWIGWDFMKDSYYLERFDENVSDSCTILRGILVGIIGCSVLSVSVAFLIGAIVTNFIFLVTHGETLAIILGTEGLVTGLPLVQAAYGGVVFGVGVILVPAFLIFLTLCALLASYIAVNFVAEIAIKKIVNSYKKARKRFAKSNLPSKEPSVAHRLLESWIDKICIPVEIKTKD